MEWPFLLILKRSRNNLNQVREFRQLNSAEDQEFPLVHFYDMRAALKRIRLKNTYMDEQEFFDLLRSLQTIARIVQFLSKRANDENFLYPTLHDLTRDILTFPEVIKEIERTLDRYGHVKDWLRRDSLRFGRK